MGEREEQNRGKPNWEHLNEDLHVLITVEDSQNRAEIKLKRAVEEVKKLLVPAVSTRTRKHTHIHTQSSKLCFVKVVVFAVVLASRQGFYAYFVVG